MYEKYLKNNSSKEEDLRFKFKAVVTCYYSDSEDNYIHFFILLNNVDISSNGYAGVTVEELSKTVKSQLKHLRNEEIEQVISNFKENSYSVCENYISIPFEHIIQSTGLHSINKELVYEGDIIQSVSTKECYCVVYSLEDGCFYLEDMKYPENLYSFKEVRENEKNEGFKVIGNVFQHIGKVK